MYINTSIIILYYTTCIFHRSNPEQQNECIILVGDKEVSGSHDLSHDLSPDLSHDLSPDQSHGLSPDQFPHCMPDFIDMVIYNVH